MQLKLYSRTAEVGGRQVKVHEMTDSEINHLKTQRQAAFLLGIAAGAGIMFMAVLIVAWIRRLAAIAPL